MGKQGFALLEAEYDQLAEQLEEKLTGVQDVIIQVGRYTPTLALRTLSGDYREVARKYSGYDDLAPTVLEAFIVFWEVTVKSRKLTGRYWISTEIVQDGVVDMETLVFLYIGNSILEAICLDPQG